jgi:transcriptional regulator with XRE-family HTH domain
MENFINRVSLNIKTYRKEKAMSQRELAEKIGLTRQQVAKLEGGSVNIKIGVLKNISNALGISINDLTK